jgi:chromosome segregation ATPase
MENFEQENIIVDNNVLLGSKKLSGMPIFFASQMSSKKSVLIPTQQHKQNKAPKPKPMQDISEILKAQMKMDSDDKIARIESLENEITEKNEEIQRQNDKITTLEETSKHQENQIELLKLRIENFQQKEQQWKLLNEEKTQQKEELENKIHELMIKQEKFEQLQKDFDFMSEQLSRKDDLLNELRFRYSKKDEQLSITSVRLFGAIIG